MLKETKQKGSIVGCAVGADARARVVLVVGGLSSLSGRRGREEWMEAAAVGIMVALPSSS